MVEIATNKLSLNWIRAARAVWILIMLFSLATFILGVPLRYGELAVACDMASCPILALSTANATYLESTIFSLQAYASFQIGLEIIVALTITVIGGLIFWKHFDNLMGILTAYLLGYIGLGVFVQSASVFANQYPPVAWLHDQLFWLFIPLLLLLVFIFPNGQFLNKFSLSVFVLALFSNIFDRILVGIPEPTTAEGTSIGSFIYLGALVVGIGSQVYKYRNFSTADEKKQTKWVLLGLASMVGNMVGFTLGIVVFPPSTPAGVIFVNTIGIVLIYFLACMFPVTMIIAIVRYKFWDIDIIISRALIYGGLTVMIVAIYSLTVGGVSLLFQTSGNFVVSLITTGLIAVIFQPVRERLQRGVNRLIFGERDDPYTVISRLNQSLQATAVPQETLTTIAQNIANILKLPHVDIELTDDNVQIGRAYVGQPVGTPLKIPLTYQQESVGRLTVSPRTPNEPFNPQEQQLLADIAAQIGPVASATRLTMALQRSRENLVLAREEERRRIRRDLHDGLGPILASQTLKLDSVLELLDEEDADTASQHVSELKGQTQQMVADIRRLVYELRPPALDELGLLEALRAHFGAGSNGQLVISIDADPEPLPSLPAAIEVAAYRTILEAVTNVIKHAKARHCKVNLVIEEDRVVSNLHVTIVDDGIGLSNKRKVGVGLVSMRERAEELGGRFTIKTNKTNRDEGTLVTTVFPYFRGAHAS